MYKILVNIINSVIKILLKALNILVFSFVILIFIAWLLFSIISAITIYPFALFIIGVKNIVCSIIDKYKNK